MPDGDLGLRIGDDERAAVDARLQQAVGRGQLTLLEYEERSAQVWRAATRGELDATTHDLPSAPAPAPHLSAPPAGGWRPRRVLAVMSGDELSGPVQPGQDVQAYTLMGGAVVDLRRDDLPAVVHVRAVAVMGGVEVLVPRGVTVHLSGASLMGARQATVDPPRPGIPVVEVQGYALMGGVDVTHGPPVPTRGSVRLDKAPARALVPAQAGPVAVARPQRRRTGRRSVVLGAVALVALGVGVPAVVSADDTAVFGSQVVHARPGQDVEVGVLFGSVKVVVDDGVPVDKAGGMGFGSTECRACDGNGSGPVVHVHGRGAFGSIQVVRSSQEDAPHD